MARVHDDVNDTQGKRYALPNTRIMLHHPSGSARGQASDIHNEARELMRLRNYVNRVLAQATGKPIEKVSMPAPSQAAALLALTVPLNSRWDFPNHSWHQPRRNVTLL